MLDMSYGSGATECVLQGCGHLIDASIPLIEGQGLEENVGLARLLAGRIVVDVACPPVVVTLPHSRIATNYRATTCTVGTHRS